MHARVRPIVPLVTAAVVAAALLAQEPDLTMPATPVLPPIPEELTRPLAGGLRVVLNDVSFSRAGARVHVPYVEVMQSPGGAPGAVRLSLLHMRGVRVTLPPERASGDGAAHSGRAAAIDLFIPLTDRPVDVARLRIEDGTVERRGTGGWHYRGIDADVRDIVIGGRRTERLHVLRADFVAEVGDRTVRLERASASVRRTGARLEAQVDAALTHSAASLRLTGTRNGVVALDGQLSTADFAELHAWVAALPRTGTGTIDALLTFDDGRFSGDLRQAEFRVGQSHLSARGALSDAAVHAAVLDIHRLTAHDLDTAFGAVLPGGGALHGRLTADGPLQQGVTVGGVLTRVAAANAREESRAGGGRVAGTHGAAGSAAGTVGAVDTAVVRLVGTVRDDAGLHVVLDATVDAGAVGDRLVSRSTGAPAVVDEGDDGVGPTALPARSARLEPLRTRLTAHMDTRAAALPVRGRMDLRSRLLLTRSGRVIPFGGAAEGVVELRGGGAIDVVIRPDSLPLELLPTPAGVRDVHGLATGELRVMGTLSEPQWRGTMTVADAGLRVPRSGTRVTEVSGTVEVAGYDVRTAGLSGKLGEGLFEISGAARVGGQAPTLDARVRLDRGRVIGLDSLWVVASADVRAAGPLRAPAVTGEVVVVDGAFLEDMTKHRTPLDLADPPHASMAVRVPWIRRSRVLPERPPRVPAGPGPRLDLDVVVTEGFRVLDEDSEMYGIGRVRLRGDVARLDATGTYRVTGGEYNNFGERFRVAGGIFHFGGDGFASRVSLRAEHDHGAPIGLDLGSDGGAADHFPPLEFFALGTLSGVTEEVRRLSLLRERSTELAALLLYGEPVEPVAGWQQERFWGSDGGGSLVGPRAQSQAVPLLWAYIADEAYDWLPLDRAYLRAGAVRVGPPFPGRLTATGLIGGGLRFAPVEVDLRQPVEGGAWAGVQLRYTTGAWRVTILNEPRFHAALLPRGYTQARRTGLRLRWHTEW